MAIGKAQIPILCPKPPGGEIRNLGSGTGEGKKVNLLPSGTTIPFWIILTLGRRVGSPTAFLKSGRPSVDPLTNPEGVMDR
jgi:hypothetical protein